MKVALIQMSVQKEKLDNINKARTLIAEVSSKGVDFVVLPEMFNCPYETNFFPNYAEEEGGYTYQELSKLAKKYNIYLIAGSIPEKDGDKVYNTSYVFDKTGKSIAKHRKVHLFEITYPNGIEFRESDTLSSGNNITTFETEFGKMGLMICFDIRFVEMARLMTLEGVKAIFVPAAFNMTTGPAHWEITFRARAIDNQVFMLGCSPSNDSYGSYEAYGNSIVIDPWGNILDRLKYKEDYIITEIDLSIVDRVKADLPILKNRRDDLYYIDENITNK